MSELEPGQTLLGMINQRGGKEQDYTDEVFGMVQSTSPLTIWVNQDMQLSGNFLELTTEAKGLTIEVELPVSGGDSKDNDKKDDKKDAKADGQVAKGKIEVFPKLKVGDNVRMLRVQKGQRFIVLGRA